MATTGSTDNIKPISEFLPRASQHVAVRRAVFQDMVYVPIFFKGNPITRPTYLGILQNWLFTLLQADLDDFIFQLERYRPTDILEFELISMKTCLRDELVGEALETALSALRLSDPRTSLCVTLSCGVY